MRTYFVSIVFGLFTMAIVSPLIAGSLVGTCVGVIDGDTIVVRDGGKVLTVSLVAVDVPELDQPFGDEAKNFTVEVALDREVVVEPAPDGSSDTVIGHVVIGETDLAVALLEAGLAWHDAIHDSQERLVIQHIMARSAKRGLWSEANPVAPWKWRAAHVPTPIPQKAMKLADVASDVELEKNADGKTVVTQPTPSVGAGSANAGGPLVTNFLGEAMCCCEVKVASDEGDDEDPEKEYVYEWQEKYACEHHAMQIIEATNTMRFFERCVNRSYCPEP